MVGGASEGRGSRTARPASHAAKSKSNENRMNERNCTVKFYHYRSKPFITFKFDLLYL